MRESRQLSPPTPAKLQGIGVSPGVVIGPAFVMARAAPEIEERTLRKDEVDAEIARFEDAIIETRRQISAILADVSERAQIKDAGFLEAHLMVLDDRAFTEEVVKGIRENLKNAEVVVGEVAGRYIKVLSGVEDDYLRERVADVKDVARRIVRNLCGGFPADDRPPEKHIVVAADLAPSETATMRKETVIGFAIDMGSPTAHSAVMARSLEIPAVVGLHDVTRRVRTGDEILIDGNKGVLIIAPTAEELAEYGRVQEARRTIQKSLTSLRHEPAETRDGYRVVLSANTEGLSEVDAVIESGAEGIGLFRSEYLYLTGNKVVSEEEQAAVYGEVAQRLAPAPVIIRTLDMGGDKFFKGASAATEVNPFLGCRSIRLSLLHPEEFKGQLRAILRASSGGNVKMMYPMISTVDEVFQANKLLDEAKQELRDAGTAFDEKLEVGVMVEIPSAAIMADAIAPHVGFFSVGTNDLVQYTLAVDRINERVAHLYEPSHPAVLNLIRMTIEAGHRHGIWVGVCGEMAADPLMTPLLLGLGVDEMSVAPPAVPLIKDAIRSLSMGRCKPLAEAALSSESPVDVLSLCRTVLKDAAPELLELI